MGERRLNIWRIKNRWLRAAAAWAVALVLLPIVYGCACLIALCEAGKAFYFEMGDFNRDLRWDHLREALTARAEFHPKQEKDDTP